jgi:thimet oligopeptidase
MPDAAASRVTLPVLDAITLTAACRQMLTDGRAAFDALAALPLDQATPASVLDEWDRIAIALENIEGPIAILNNVHPDKRVRDAADEAIRSLSTFQVEIFQNEALFARVQAVAPETPAQAQFKKDLVEAFEDTGVALPPDRRARAKAIAGSPSRTSLASLATSTASICSRTTTLISTRSWRTPNPKRRGDATTSAI